MHRYVCILFKKKTHENFNTYTLIYHIEKHFPNTTSNTLAGPGAGGQNSKTVKLITIRIINL